MAEVFVKEFIFAISLLGTTIQDGGMRERSDGLYYFPIPLDFISYILQSILGLW